MSAVIDNLLAEARRKHALPPPPLRRLLREQAGLTQAEIAQVLGVGRPTVTRYESGVRDPRSAVGSRTSSSSNASRRRPMTETLLTARVVADHLDVSTETVLRWTRRGELPVIRLPGGRLRYRAAALATWLETHERPAAGTPGARSTSTTAGTDGDRVPAD